MCKKKSTISKQINIISKRNRNHELYFHIVYEWEDCLGNLLNIPVKSEGIWTVMTNKACKQLHFPVTHTFDLLTTNITKKIFRFDLTARQNDDVYNNNKYISCIIDYYLRENQYDEFLKAYNRNALVLISSREVYEYLVSHNCPLPIEHFPLSIPKYYWQDSYFKKEYDLVMCGRQNPVLERYSDMVVQLAMELAENLISYVS